MSVLSKCVATDATRLAASLTAGDVISSVQSHVAGDFSGHNVVGVIPDVFPITVLASGATWKAHTIPNSVELQLTINIDQTEYTIVVPAIQRAASDTGQQTKPYFTGSAYSQAVGLGKSVAITASVTGTTPIFLQWRFNGTPVTGANSATLKLTSFQSSNQGNYDCVATNSAGQSTSPVYTLTLIGNTASPALSQVSVGTKGQSSLVTQSELDAVNVALYNLTKNLNAHVNSSMSVAHGLNAEFYDYYDSAGDLVGNIVLAFSYGSGSSTSAVYVPAIISSNSISQSGGAVNTGAKTTVTGSSVTDNNWVVSPAYAGDVVNTYPESGTPAFVPSISSLAGGYAPAQYGSAWISSAMSDVAPTGWYNFGTTFPWQALSGSLLIMSLWVDSDTSSGSANGTYYVYLNGNLVYVHTGASFPQVITLVPVVGNNTLVVACHQNGGNGPSLLATFTTKFASQSLSTSPGNALFTAGDGVNYAHATAEGVFLSPGLPIANRVLVTDLIVSILQNIEVYSNVLAYHATTTVGDTGSRICHQGTSYFTTDTTDSLGHVVGRQLLSFNCNGIQYGLVCDINKAGPPLGPVIVDFRSYFGGGEQYIGGSATSTPFPLYPLPIVPAPSLLTPWVAVGSNVYSQANVVTYFQWQYSDPWGSHQKGQDGWVGPYADHFNVPPGEPIAGGPWINMGPPLTWGGVESATGVTVGHYNCALYWYTSMVSSTKCLLGGVNNGTKSTNALYATGPSGAGQFLNLRCVVRNSSGTTYSKGFLCTISDYNT